MGDVDSEGGLDLGGGKIAEVGVELAKGVVESQVWLGGKSSLSARDRLPLAWRATVPARALWTAGSLRR